MEAAPAPTNSTEPFEPVRDGRWWVAPAVFVLITVTLFGDVLFVGDRVLSAPDTDLTLQFLSWRKFGFGELARGNLPLWNPHVFGGAPFFAGFQSALLYPPNWLHLFLPLGVAINWITALHVFAAGYFTYLWCRRGGREISIPGSIVAGAMFMMCGPFFLHIYAGHLPHVAVIPWIPLVLLAIAGLARSGSPRWACLGAAAVSMQTLAGHPQYVYYTGIVAFVYMVLSLMRSPCRTPLFIGFVRMYVIAAMVTAVQLLPGLALASETVRAGGLSIGMAGTFSLPPENLLTLLAPNVLGALPADSPSQAAAAGIRYFGRAYLWETQLFMSVCGFALAVLGACFTPRPSRRFAVTMVVVCLVLALGRHTPLYEWMYRFVPRYDSFRGTVKFAVVAAAFAAVLAALGFDVVAGGLRTLSRRQRQVIAGAFAAAALAVALGAVLISVKSRSPERGTWSAVLREIASSHSQRDDNELFSGLPVERYSEPSFITESAKAALPKLAIAAGLLAAAGAVVFLAARLHGAFAYALVIMVCVELVVYARSTCVTTNPTLKLPPPWLDALSSATADARVLVIDPSFMNSGMYFGFNGVWGYDPGVLKRYAELLTFSQGGDPDRAMQYIPFRGVDRSVFRAIRCGLVLLNDRARPVVTVPDPLPTGVLIRNHLVQPNRSSLFTMFRNPGFDPRATVLLESQPKPAPDPAGLGGQVETTRRSTDEFEFRIDTATAAVLLVTENFAAGWHVTPLGASSPQPEYAILPANWTHMAIPLAAGQHHVLLKYRPSSYTIGKWISAATLTAIGTMLVVNAKRGRHAAARQLSN